MARFVFYRSFEPRPNDRQVVYLVEFLDPRTVEDSSLLHALFVAHPKSAAARDRVLELFIVQYLLEHKQLAKIAEFNVWAVEQNYPELPFEKVRELCNASEDVERIAAGVEEYRLKTESEKRIRVAQAEFANARSQCVRQVRDEIVKYTGTDIEQFDLGALIEEYLGAVFCEIRMMANYFRDTFHIAPHDTKLFRRFDFILHRRLPLSSRSHFEGWRDAFIGGLKAVCQQNNAFIAAVFHNVLATYYLNRSTGPSAYQLDKVAQRQIYIDTNVLYALLVPASNYHDAVQYFVSRLRAVGVVLKIYPFSVAEYEASLLKVEREASRNESSAYLLSWNPWVYQEYRSNKARYLNNFAACRRVYSLAQDSPICPETYDALDASLGEHGVVLDRSFERLSQEQIDELWAEMRTYMTGFNWSLEKYYDFIFASTRSPEKVSHDTSCVYNLSKRAEECGSDELGPKLLFVTLDRHLARTRKKYGFIVSSEQFLEFMMPYLFLSDIPLLDAEEFPNQLLGAQLATLLTNKKIEIVDVVAGFFQDPEIAKKIDGNRGFGPLATKIATALSSTRFADAVEAAGNPAHEHANAAVIQQIAESLEKDEQRSRQQYFSKEATEVVRLKQELDRRDREIRKLRGVVRYMRKHGEKQD